MRRRTPYLTTNEETRLVKNALLINQRWRHRRESYRPAGEPIVTKEYEISETRSDRLVRPFVEMHHYLQSCPPARFRFCLYRGEELVGVAVFAHPTKDLTITGTFGCSATDGVELSRLVLLDTVPGNGESFFVGACFRQLRKHLAGVVSFSDPIPRRTAEGILIKPGHCGTVYQALNGRFVGLSSARTLRLLPDGTVLSDRTIQKLRAGEPGTKRIRETLASLGVSLPSGAVGSELSSLLDQHTRSFRHTGNYKYAWPFHRSAERHLPPSLPYPKLDPLFYHSAAGPLMGDNRNARSYCLKKKCYPRFVVAANDFFAFRRPAINGTSQFTGSPR
jgi:hypothetical protein